MAEMMRVALCCEVGIIEASVIVGDKVREVLPNEAQVGRTGARLEKQRVGGEEAGVYCGGVAGNGVDGFRTVGDSWEKRRAENSCGKASLTQAANSIEAKIRSWRARLKQSGEFCVGRRDGDVHDEMVAAVDLLKQVSVAQDEARLGHDADTISAMPGEDLEQAACNAGAPLDRLPRVSRGTDGDFI